MNACVKVHCQHWAFGKDDVARKPLGAGSSCVLAGRHVWSWTGPFVKDAASLFTRWEWAEGVGWGRWLFVPLNSPWDEDAAEWLESVSCCPFSQGLWLWEGQWDLEQSRGQTDGLCQCQLAPVLTQDAQQLAAIILCLVLKGFPPTSPLEAAVSGMNRCRTG